MLTKENTELAQQCSLLNPVLSEHLESYIQFLNICLSETVNKRLVCGLEMEKNLFL